MITIEGPSVIFYDVDNTLIMWTKDHKGFTIDIVDPTGNVVKVQRNETHGRMLRTNKAAGHKIVVWSRQGSKWAETVVCALGLDSYVDLCISKPLVYVDDHLDFFNPKEVLNHYISGEFGE